MQGPNVSALTTLRDTLLIRGWMTATASSPAVKKRGARSDEEHDPEQPPRRWWLAAEAAAAKAYLFYTLRQEFIKAKPRRDTSLPWPCPLRAPLGPRFFFFFLKALFLSKDQHDGQDTLQHNSSDN